MGGVRAPRTLPGFRFETKAPPLVETLPRMDSTVFVGFAASGPLQTPVALESEAQFESLFGQDAPLAWDVARGEQVYAYLAPAVRAFFRNGGQRCWVIRVARREALNAENLNRARYNYFPIPGLGRAEFRDNGTIALAPAFTRARSEGSWSDSLSVGSALLTRPEQTLQPMELDGGDYVVQVARPAAEEFAPGDLLRLTFKAEGYVLFLTVAEIETLVGSPPLSQRTLRITGSKPLWFEVVSPDTLAAAGSAAQVHVFTHESTASSGIDGSEIAAGFETVYDATFNPDEALADKTIFDLVDCPPADAPEPGAVIGVDINGKQIWMTVESLDFKASESITTVSGEPVRWLQAAPALPATIPACERVTFELWVRKAEEYSLSLSDLGFESQHKRFWGSLPTDESLYQDLLDDVAPDPPSTVLWRQIGDLFRFPLAGMTAAADEVYFPLAMAALPETFLGPVTLPGSELQRDGLAEFDAALFIDPDLVSVHTEALASQAEFLMYLSSSPRKLNGMHAAFPIEEATIIAIPDAVHRGWSPRPEEDLPEPVNAPPELPPDWWHYVECRPPLKDEEAPKLTNCDSGGSEEFVISTGPPLGSFLNCAITTIPAPELIAAPAISASGTFTLSWSLSPPVDAKFVLEESTIADFNDAETIYSGAQTSFTIYGRKTGDYFYRVRATVGVNQSDWSPGVTVRVAAEARWSLTPEEDYSPDVLLAVQRSLLRMCTARGDLFCVLSLPAEYREDKAIEHVATLKASLNVPATQGVDPLTTGETNNFSYAAVYHPWLINAEGKQDDDGLRRIPPCGAISGVFARRALTRGAWIAPANEPLRGLVALAPPINRERRLEIQNAGINLVRQEPRGFLVLDSDTLSDDEDYRPINVRRLLILLRRQALRVGARYVFEPNSPAFRRLVERGFTGMLDQMFERGAFAGATPATAYQVVTDASLNTSQSVDLGRFIVELRVAPSLPLTFLTIRFIQTGDRSFVTEVR